MNGYAIFLAILTITVTAANAEILKREPPMGALKEGQVVLVDDGTCPSGQVNVLSAEIT